MDELEEIMEQASEIALENGAIDVIAVSYTHLDGYKRQVVCASNL